MPSTERGLALFHIYGTKSELTPCFSWHDQFSNFKNLTRSARFIKALRGTSFVGCPESGITDCCLMNIFGSQSLHGPVIRATAGGRRGNSGSFTDFMRQILVKAYPVDR